MSGTNPPTEGTDLRALVGHREAVAQDELLENVQQKFAAGRHDFMAVLDGARLVGLCSRRDVGTLLGARYGFAFYGRKPVGAHLTQDTITIRVTDRLTDVLQAIAARRDEHFYDDLLLVDEGGAFLGLIYIRDLVRLQTGLLMGNIEELRASQEEIAARNRQMEHDLLMAREVQLAMLPGEFPAGAVPGGSGLRFAHLYQPAGGVGGDFFDVLPLGDRVAGVIICDVMGHGVRSALITAMVRTLLEELRAEALSPGPMLTQVNAHLTRLLQRTGEVIFVTAAYMVLDAAHHRLRYAQAGHPAPLLARAAGGRAEPLPGADTVGGPALGLIGDFVFESLEHPLASGDRLLFYTDGLVEADNAGGEEFGVRRLADEWQARRGAELKPALISLVAAASRFSDGRPFGDDVCLVGCEAVE